VVVVVMVVAVVVAVEGKLNCSSTSTALSLIVGFVDVVVGGPSKVYGLVWLHPGDHGPLSLWPNQTT